MGENIRGMVVYHRGTWKRGKVTASNEFTGMVAVAYDDGTRELAHVSSLMSEKIYQEKLEEERELKMSLPAAEATIGAVVYQKSKSPPLRRGKIAGPLNGSILIVEWDDGSLSKHELRFLFNEVTGLAENQRLLDEQDRLEREFDNAKSLIAEKLEAAAKLINEAAVIANDKNVSIVDMYNETRDLERAMGNAGWNTSSWGC